MNTELVRASLTIGFSFSTLIAPDLAVSPPSHQRTGLIPQLDRAVATSAMIK